MDLGRQQASQQFFESDVGAPSAFLSPSVSRCDSPEGRQLRRALEVKLCLLPGTRAQCSQWVKLPTYLKANLNAARRVRLYF